MLARAVEPLEEVPNGLRRTLVCATKANHLRIQAVVLTGDAPPARRRGFSTRARPRLRNRPTARTGEEGGADLGVRDAVGAEVVAAFLEARVFAVACRRLCERSATVARLVDFAFAFLKAVYANRQHEPSPCANQYAAAQEREDEGTPVRHGDSLARRLPKRITPGVPRFAFQALRSRFSEAVLTTP
jgi:hypothetical protein